MNIKYIIEKINQMPLQLRGMNSTRSVGAILTSTVQGTILFFFLTSSHKNLSHVHVVELCLLLPLFATDGNFT